MPQDPNDFSASGLPFFEQIAKAMSSAGPVQWDMARQFAIMTATNSSAEPNVEPTSRIAVHQLATIADLHVRDITGLSTSDTTQPPVIEVVNRSTWVHHTIDAFKFYFSDFSGDSISANSTESLELESNGMDAMMSNLTKMMAPAMLGMSVGSMIGQLSLRTFGQYDLPLPREPKSQLLFVARNSEEFAKDWSIKVEDMQMWLLIQELTFHALFRIKFVRDAVTDLVKQHVAGFHPNPNALGQRLTNIDVTDTDPAAMMQKLLGDPTLLLGNERSAKQQALAPKLDAIICAIICYVDHVVDTVANRVLGNGAQISEAFRRRRVESSSQDQYVERLFGIYLTDDQVERGEKFIAGVIERQGETGLARLWTRDGNLPTPNEIGAPGLWIERINL
ncbi:MAG: zinc-dependent metalloprotease [Actinomycetota bacterium]|nr:zinc-dependent metalloprotease [Actinomycetota bacterium]MDA2982493.1 zinc-dependent metalloprotease [Actinomycetota bacterium]MDA3041496.1 zinc-dependent metalloprotease [Actinomycetota bacterium]